MSLLREETIFLKMKMKIRVRTVVHSTTEKLMLFWGWGNGILKHERGKNIQLAIGPYEDLLTFVKTYKLNGRYRVVYWIF